MEDIATPYEVVVWLQHGRNPLSDGSGARTGGLLYSVAATEDVKYNDLARYSMAWKETPEPDRPAFIAAGLRKLERRYGITQWYTDHGRVTSKKPKPSSKGKKIWSLCSATVHHDSWTSSGVCSRPIVEEGASRCGIHAAAQKRKDATRERWNEESRLRREQWERERHQTGDLKELWELACETYDIAPERRGNPGVRGSDALVDHEVLTRLLRTLVELGAG